MQSGSFGFVLALALFDVTAGGCGVADGDSENSQAAEVVTPGLAAFVLTVDADVESDITVTTTNSTSTCPANSFCNFAYVAGTSLTVRTKAQNLADCEKLVGWDGACSGQTNVCSLIINSDLSTGAVYGPIHGCVPR